MNELWSRWKIAIVMVGVATAASLALLIAFRPSAAPQPEAAAPPVRPQASAPPSSPTLVVPAPVASSAAPKPASSQGGASPWPTPKPVTGVTATWDPNFGDPFESEAGVPGAVRQLVQVGAIRLGVTHASKVKNEAAVKSILAELGAEIDKREKGRSESFEVRLQEYQSVYEKIRPRLGEHMEGSFALKGDGWTDTEPLVLPPQGEAGAPHGP